ncbi:MAG: hypothetical protein GPJ54_04995 [Candidatus Heimdallarchaeota archaeon]|nr:hypothetical protein [Candidatus Heimdallarchaeota archaeon]
MNQRVESVCGGNLDDIKPTKEQLKRIESFSEELTEICDMSPKSANQLIFFSITKWQNETKLYYKDGLNMSYTERLKHKAKIFELGKDCISQLISCSEEIERVNKFIDKKMYEYLSRLR